MIDSLLALLLHHRRWLLTLALAWMALIFILSAQSSIQVPNLFMYQDKALHSLLFGALGFFWALLVMSDGTRPSLWHVLIVSLLVMGYGGLDEFHQSLVPGRSPDILDLAADTGGGLVSALLVMVLLRRYARR
jgi:VanZ family protein